MSLMTDLLLAAGDIDYLQECIDEMVHDTKMYEEHELGVKGPEKQLEYILKHYMNDPATVRRVFVDKFFPEGSGLTIKPAPKS